MTSREPYKDSFGNTGYMFFASVLLHLILLATVIMTVPGASRQLTFGAPYSVALVGPEVMQSPQQNAEDARNILQPLPSTHPVILKQNTEISKSVAVIKKVDTAKTDIQKAINAIRQKDLSSAEDNKVNRASAATQRSGTSTASSENQSRINDYGRFIWTRVKKNWSLPASLMPKSNVEAIIEVRIAQSGALEYIGFEKRSGNSYFDESALRAVKKSVPFPPLTGWMTDRTIEIGIRFHSAELR